MLDIAAAIVVWSVLIDTLSKIALKVSFTNVGKPVSGASKDARSSAKVEPFWVPKRGAPEGASTDGGHLSMKGDATAVTPSTNSKSSDKSRSAVMSLAFSAFWRCDMDQGGAERWRLRGLIRALRL